MNWFETLCRNAGLFVHHVVKPVRSGQREVISKTVQEKKVAPTVTLRRTTIEEIELSPPPEVTPGSVGSPGSSATGSSGSGSGPRTQANGSPSDSDPASGSTKAKMDDAEG